MQVDDAGFKRGGGRDKSQLLLTWPFVAKHTAPNEEVQKFENKIEIKTWQSLVSFGGIRGKRNRAESERQEVTLGEKKRQR